MRVRIRYSLRSLLVFAVTVAGCCYWLTLPSVYAERFVAAVAAGDYATADGLFADPDDRFLVQCDNDHTIVKREVTVNPCSWWQILCGQRQISLRIVYRTPAHTDARYWLIVVTRAGLGPPQRPQWSGSGGMGGGLATRSRIPPPSALPFRPSAL